MSLNIIQLESSTSCNAHCLICPRDQIQRKKGQMSQELFEKIVCDGTEMGVKQFLLFLYGEPLAFPKLFDWLDYLRDRGLTSTIFTNASLLTEEKAERLGSYPNLTDIIVSFHGATKETYEKMMGLPFEETKAKVDYLLEVAINSVQVYMVDCPLTHGEIGLFEEMWKGHKHFIGSYFNYSGKRPDAPMLNNPHPCDRVMENMAILWDGTVNRCCFDYEGEVKLGDVRVESIKEIWERDQVSRDRHLHLDFSGMPLCESCNYNRF